MDILVALGHIAGTILVVSLFGAVVISIGAWETSLIERKGLEEVALNLRIPVEDLDRQENYPRIIEFASNKFSSGLLRNRIAELCGAVRTMWGGIGTVAQIGLLLIVSWYTFTDDLSFAVSAWFAVPITIVFWVVAVIFSLLCKFLTGRYPGQPKRVRAGLLEYINAQRSNDMVFNELSQT